MSKIPVPVIANPEMYGLFRTRLIIFTRLFLSENVMNNITDVEEMRTKPTTKVTLLLESSIVLLIPPTCGQYVGFESIVKFEE